MESSRNLPKQYFVVVTHNPALQLELEALLSSERYNSFDTSQAKMFVEGAEFPFSTPELVEFIYPHVKRMTQPVIRQDTQRVISTFTTERQGSQLDNQLNSIVSITYNAKDDTRDGTSRTADHRRPSTEGWRISSRNGALIKDDIEIVLTGLEATLVKKMLHHDDRVVSKDELIRSIGREPENYRGLEMCMSRLQEKFKSASNGERLFRAVRNRGYCLIQKIARGKS